MRRAREYRKMSRDTLGNGIFTDKWMWALLALFVESLLLGLVSATGVGIIVTIVIAGPLAYGTIAIFLRAARGEDERADLNHLFDGFKEKFGESFLTELLCTIFIFLWSLLLIIPGIIKSYSYAATMYIVREKGLSGTDAITLSRKIMKGKKWKLFCLQLSFIGWYLLGLLCFGVGVLWVNAYQQMAVTHFMEDALNEVTVE